MACSLEAWAVKSMSHGVSIQDVGHASACEMPAWMPNNMPQKYITIGGTNLQQEGLYYPWVLHSTDTTQAWYCDTNCNLLHRGPYWQGGLHSWRRNCSEELKLHSLDVQCKWKKARMNSKGILLICGTGLILKFCVICFWLSKILHIHFIF